MAGEGAQAGATPVKPAEPRTYWVEGIYMVVLLIYGINYFIGKRTNTGIASRWCAIGPRSSPVIDQISSPLRRALANRDVLAENFSKSAWILFLVSLPLSILRESFSPLSLRGFPSDWVLWQSARAPFCSSRARTASS